MGEVKTEVVEDVVMEKKEVLFLIKRDDEEICMNRSEYQALLILDSLACREEAFWKSQPGISKCYREEVGDNKIVISCQRDGVLFSGYPEVQTVFSYVEVCMGSITKSRFWLPDSQKVDTDSEEDIEIDEDEELKTD